MRIRDAHDHDAWHDFVALYAPLIHAYGMRRGLQDADAADVAQQVLQSIAQAMPGFEYDPTKGSFRGWLFTTTRNAIYKSYEKQRRVPTATGDTTFHVRLAEEPASEEVEAWNQEHQRRLVQWAADKTRADFREQTWKAFQATAIEGRPAAEVAAELAMSVGALYIAKSRVTAAIRAIIEAAEWE